MYEYNFSFLEYIIVYNRDYVIIIAFYLFINFLMTDLTQQLDAMFTREHLERNKYLLKNLDPNLNLPIVTIQNEYSLGKPTIEELLAVIIHWYFEGLKKV